MARERLVTRTIYRTTVKVLGLNLETAQAEERDFEFSGAYVDEKTTLKSILTPVQFSAVKVLGYKTEELLYGMTEDDFIRFGKVLPPRKDYSAQ